MHIFVVGGLKSFGVLFVEIKSQYDVSSKAVTSAQGIAMTLMMGCGEIAI